MLFYLIWLQTLQVIKKTDNLQIMALVEAATDFAVKFLKQDGSFVAKVLDAGAGPEIQKLVNN